MQEAKQQYIRRHKQLIDSEQNSLAYYENLIRMPHHKYDKLHKQYPGDKHSLGWHLSSIESCRANIKYFRECIIKARKWS